MFAVKSSAEPPATSQRAVPTPQPTTHSGGTRAMPMAAPAAVDAVPEGGRTVVKPAINAQSAATKRSSAVGTVRDAISVVSSWNGSAVVRSAAPATTVAMLKTVRTTARTTSTADPTARPMPIATSGVISGETSIAPMTTAALPRTSPSVAMPIDTQSWNQ